MAPRSAALIPVARVRKHCLSRQGLRTCLALLAYAILQGGTAAQAEDLTSYVQISQSALVFNPVSKSFDARVTVKNTSTITLLGPLKLALANVQPVDVALYNSRGRLSSGAAAGADYLVLPLSTGTLEAGASTQTTLRLTAPSKDIGTITFVLDGERLLAGQTGTLKIRAVYAGADGQGARQTPVGAGYQVLINDVLRGLTDAAGRQDVVTKAGLSHISVRKSPGEGGNEIANLVPGASMPVTVVMDGGKEVPADGFLRLDAVQQGMLSRSAPRIALRFEDSREQSIKLSYLSSVTMLDWKGSLVNLTDLFSVQPDGSVAAESSAFYVAIFYAGASRHTLTVVGEDAAENVYEDSVNFYLADHRVRVQLMAPPSNPGLRLADVVLTASMLGSPIRFKAQSDATGLVTLPDLPEGNVDLSASTVDGTKYYIGDGTTFLRFNALISLNMRASQDVLAGVPAIAAVQELPTGRSDFSARAARKAPSSSEANKAARDAALQR